MERRSSTALGTRRGPFAIAVTAAALTGCAGELTVLAALAFGMTLGAWILGSSRHRRALYEAETLKHAIATGQHRALEGTLRSELALAEAGEAVSLERQWLARAQLGGLMVAEWRLDEAAQIYGTDDDEAKMGPHLRALAAFGRHELALLTEPATEARLQQIRLDRDECLRHVPGRFRKDVAAAWNAVEGLCLIRMGHAREAVPLLEKGLASLEYNPALVVYQYHLGQAYEHLGERRLAAAQYEKASRSFPGTRLASDAQARLRALGPGQGGLFRGMLPEAPEPTEVTALAVRDDAGLDDAGRDDAGRDDDEDEREVDDGEDEREVDDAALADDEDPPKERSA